MNFWHATTCQWPDKNVEDLTNCLLTVHLQLEWKTESKFNLFNGLFDLQTAHPKAFTKNCAVFFIHSVENMSANERELIPFHIENEHTFCGHQEWQNSSHCLSETEFICQKIGQHNQKFTWMFKHSIIFVTNVATAWGHEWLLKWSTFKPGIDEVAAQQKLSEIAAKTQTSCPSLVSMQKTHQSISRHDKTLDNAHTLLHDVWVVLQVRFCKWGHMGDCGCHNNSLITPQRCMTESKIGETLSVDGWLINTSHPAVWTSKSHLWQCPTCRLVFGERFWHCFSGCNLVQSTVFHALPNAPQPSVQAVFKLANDTLEMIHTPAIEHTFWSCKLNL